MRTKHKVDPILEKVRKKGRRGDTILAHINPIEAAMLKAAGGSGTINPKTGLPEFGLLKKPGKWLAGSTGGATGAILGNMIMPGIGGVIGGALGGAAGSAVRGRKDYGKAALRGGQMGAVLPTAASVLGSGATALGATDVGTSLSNYGTDNSIMTALGLNNPNTGNLGAGDVGGETDLLDSLSNGKGKGQASFMDKLTGKSSNFFSDPKNLMAMLPVAGAMYEKSKQKKPLTPAERGRMRKEEMLAERLSPEELAQQEAYELELLRGRRRNNRKKFLPEERIDIQPLHVKVNSPQEYAKNRQWLSYYNNPQYTGNKVNF